MKWLGIILLLSVGSLSKKLKTHQPEDPVKYPDDYCETMINGESFDFVVVGGGPAGCVLARRLADVGTYNVLLLEAGGNPPPMTDIPANAIKIGFDLRWKFKTALSSDECQAIVGGSCLMIPGKVLGGSSVINYMMYNRGNPKDYDEWASDGNSGWSYKEVLPYFKRMENYIAHKVSKNGTGGLDLKVKNGRSLDSKSVEDTVNADYHGTDGPLTAAAFQLDPKTHHFRKNLLKSFVANGIQENIDTNGPHQMGVTELPGMVDSLGYRLNAAKAYLQNIPQNLKVCLHSSVSRVILDGDKVTDVEFLYSGKGSKFLRRTMRVKVIKEALISAGPLHTPGVLERSGIGRRDVIHGVGLRVNHELPGVGENYFDQYINLGSAFKVDFLTDSEGNPLTTDMTSMTAFVKLGDLENDLPDIQYIMKTYASSVALGLGFKPDIGLQFNAVKDKTIVFISSIILRQTQTGSVHIAQGENPDISPIIISKQFSAARDVNLTVQATRLIRRILEHDNLKQFKVEPFVLKECDKFEFNSADEIMCGARYLANTLYHQGGTCKMGSHTDKSAVVNNKLMVIGLKNLRVVDGSIMPEVSRGNTQVPTMMIAEKGADIILKDHGLLSKKKV